MTTAAVTNYVAFDLETTGVHVVNDRIVTAAVVGGNRYPFHLLLNPGIPISEEAVSVHGITNAHAAEHGVDYAEGLLSIGDALTCAWDSGATVVGHNILGFDLPMLRMQERKILGKSRTRFGAVIDTYVEYKKAFPDRSHKLVNACTHLGVVLDNAHDAASDAQASLDVAVVLSTLSY